MIQAGFEPTTYGLEGRCSIKASKAIAFDAPAELLDFLQLSLFILVDVLVDVCVNFD